MVKLTEIITMLTEQDRLGPGGSFERQQQAMRGLTSFERKKADDKAFDKRWRNKRMDYVDSTRCYCGKDAIDQTSDYQPQQLLICDIKRKLEKLGFICIGTRKNQPSPYNGPTFNSLKFLGTSKYKNIIIQVNTSAVGGKDQENNNINYPKGDYIVGYHKDKDELGVDRDYALKLMQSQIQAGIDSQLIADPKFGTGYVDPSYHIDPNNMGNSIDKLNSKLSRLIRKTEIDKETIQQKITKRLIRKALLKKIENNEYQELISRGIINPITSLHYTREEIKNGDREKYKKFKFGQDYTLEITDGPAEDDGLPAVKINVFKSAIMDKAVKDAALAQKENIYKMGYIQDKKGYNNQTHSIAVHFASPRPSVYEASKGDLIYIKKGWPGSENKAYKITGKWTDANGKLGAVYINSPEYFKTTHKKNLKLVSRDYENFATIEIERQITPYKARPGAPKF
jgi:hypothetical protein